MSKFRHRILVLRSWAEALRRVLERKPTLSYGREEFFSEFWTNAAGEIGANIDPVGNNVYRIHKARRSTLVQFHYVNIDSYFNWMLVAQKPYICELLANLGCRVPLYLEYDIRSVEKARQFVEEHGGRFVVKPRSGAGGGGVTTGIDSYKRLRQASVSAAAHFSTKLMIEQEFPGDSYRLLYLNGELIDAIKRCRPTVIGDGTHSIRKLIDAENERRRNGDRSSRSLFELKPDLDSKFFLQDQGKRLDHVPAAGETQIVKNVANENSQRDNFVVRENVHPEFLKLGHRVSQSLGVQLIGIDIMTTDISVALSESGGIVNEINIPPGLHYHEMVANDAERARIGPRILEFLLSGRTIPMSIDLDMSS